MDSGPSQRPLTRIWSSVGYDSSSPRLFFFGLEWSSFCAWLLRCSLPLPFYPASCVFEPLRLPNPLLSVVSHCPCHRASCESKRHTPPLFLFPPLCLLIGQVGDTNVRLALRFPLDVPRCSIVSTALVAFTADGAPVQCSLPCLF